MVPNEEEEDWSWRDVHKIAEKKKEKAALQLVSDFLAQPGCNILDVFFFFLSVPVNKKATGLWVAEQEDDTPS